MYLLYKIYTCFMIVSKWSYELWRDAANITLERHAHNVRKSILKNANRPLIKEGKRYESKIVNS